MSPNQHPTKLLVTWSSNTSLRIGVSGCNDISTSRRCPPQRRLRFARPPNGWRQWLRCRRGWSQIRRELKGEPVSLLLSTVSSWRRGTTLPACCCWTLGTRVRSGGAREHWAGCVAVGSDTESCRQRRQHIPRGRSGGAAWVQWSPPVWLFCGPQRLAGCR